MKTYFVYILYCSDHSYYVGITNHIDRRLIEHNEGYNTHNRRPVKIVFVESFNNVNNAIEFEKNLKAGQEKKRKL